MPEPLQVDPDQIIADSGHFTDLADAAHSTGSGLLNGISMCGNFPGTDKFGKLFNASFTPAVTGLANSVISLGSAFLATAQGLVASAGKMVQADEAAADSVPAPPSLPVSPPVNSPADSPISPPRRA